MSAPPLKYGDHDTLGDPAALLDLLEQTLAHGGVKVSMDAVNSYDLTMSLTGHGAARLLHRLVEDRWPDHQETEVMIQLLVGEL